MGDFLKNIAALFKVKTIVTMVVAFYFGTQTESKNKKDE